MATPQSDEKIQRIITIVSQMFGFEQFESLLNNLVKTKYETALETMEAKFNQNFLPDPRILSMLQDTANTAFKGFSDDMTNKLIRTMQEGISQNESIQMISKRVEDFFSNKPNPTRFDWKTRLDTILRTESNRAYNRGVMQSGQDSGLKGLKKWLAVVVDNRTSNICMAEHSKYGSKEKAIPFDTPFVVKVDNKTYSSQQSPFHVNCRTRVMIETGDAV